MTVTIEDAARAKQRAEEQIRQILLELEKETGLKPVPCVVTLTAVAGGEVFKRIAIDLKL